MKGYAIQLIRDPQLEKVLQPAFDIQRDQHGKVVRGLKLGSTQSQNEALILSSNAGEYKNSPFLGVGLENALLEESSDLLPYRHAIRRNYQMEGLVIVALDLFKLTEINIKAHYR